MKEYTCLVSSTLILMHGFYDGHNTVFFVSLESLINFVHSERLFTLNSNHCRIKESTKHCHSIKHRQFYHAKCMRLIGSLCFTFDCYQVIMLSCVQCFDSALGSTGIMATLHGASRREYHLMQLGLSSASHADVASIFNSALQRFVKMAIARNQGQVRMSQLIFPPLTYNWEVKKMT